VKLKKLEASSMFKDEVQRLKI